MCNATGVSIGQQEEIYLMSINTWGLQMDVKFPEKHLGKNIIALLLGTEQ